MFTERKCVLLVAASLIACVPFLGGQGCLTPAPEDNSIAPAPLPPDADPTPSMPMSPPTPISPSPNECSAGMAPAVNDPNFCCPEDLPFLDGIVCVTGPPDDDDDACPPGRSPALNDPAVCCPDDFPYSTGSLCTANPNP